MCARTSSPSPHFVLLLLVWQRWCGVFENDPHQAGFAECRMNHHIEDHGNDLHWSALKCWSRARSTVEVTESVEIVPMEGTEWVEMRPVE